MMENPNFLPFFPFLLIVSTVLPINTDKLLLLSFKNRIHSDPLSLLNKWISDDVSPCSWPGVACSDPQPNGSTASLRVTALSLPGARLRGSIPPDLGFIEHLTHLDLSHNNLSGSVPVGFNRTQYLDLSSNRFEGFLPEEAYGGDLRYLNFSYNKLSGGIPYRFASGVSSNATIDVSFNEFSGAIPGSVAWLNQKIASFEGNEGLCGKPLRVLCSIPYTASIAPAMAVMPITERSEGDSKKGVKISTILIITAADFAGIAIFALVIFYVYHLRSKREENRVFISECKSSCCLKASEAESPKKGGTLVMMDEEIELDIETLFKSSAFVLGSNRGSILYKSITADGRVFAVRRIGRNQDEKFLDFKNRIKYLAKLKHENLVRVRGFYWGDEEKLIVCDHVHSNLSNLITRLSIEPRFKISKGIARGLAFIHDKKRVHGNVKPSNILVTADLEAVVSDFGVPTEKGFESSPYRAPELVEKVKPDQKCDVFSFGVILLELFTGRVRVEREIEEWVDGSVEMGLDRFGRLVEYGSQEELESCEKGLVAVLGLGFKCVSSVPCERPSMKEALLLLQKL